MLVDRRRAQRDRREALRVPSVFAVKCLAGGRIQLCQAEDIGPAGMTLRRPRDQSWSPGTQLVLTFALPGMESLMGAAAAVVSDRYAGAYRRTGVRFTALAAEHEQRICCFCNDATGEPYLSVRVA
jgi:hypothetical protein